MRDWARKANKSQFVDCTLGNKDLPSEQKYTFITLEHMDVTI